MTKRNLIDEVAYILEKHDSQNHKAIIETVLNGIYNQIMGEIPESDLRQFEFYTKDFQVSISQDSHERYYSDLPAQVVQLKKPQQGVVSINTIRGTGFLFVPTTERRIRLMDGFEADSIEGTHVFYYLKRNRVYYHKMSEFRAESDVRMSLAVQFRDFDEDDEVPLPSGRDYDIKQLAIDAIRQSSIIDLQIPK